MTPDEQILGLLKSWAPEVTNLLDRAGYFDLPEGIKKDQIAKEIGFQRGGKLYNRVLVASKEKNGKITDIVLDEYSLREFKAGAKKVAKQLSLSFSAWDWNAAAQSHFKTHGLQLVKQMSDSDLDSLAARIQNDFNLNPIAFAQKFAEHYPCSESRLERIKRTETHTESQAGGQQFALDADCKFKQWLCTPRDQWPRPSHREVWYEIKPIDEPFSNGLMWPSDPNCRCYLLYFIDEDHLERSAKEAS